jgi:2-phospho-L-lactate guanylyltransferase
VWLRPVKPQRPSLRQRFHFEVIQRGHLVGAGYHPSVTEREGASDTARADLSTVHVVVPVRGIESGKSRLGQALDAEEREVLVLGLLGRTLDVLAAWSAAQRVYLVTGDATTAELARRALPTLTVVGEPRNGGLNGALRAARDAATAAGATAVLMLPADLPVLEVAALDRLLDGADAALAAGNGRPLVVVAPSDARGGTNALLLAPPNVIEPCFGESSLSAHLEAAANADATVQLVIDPAFGFDLDTPDDFERLDTAALLELERRGQEMLAVEPAAR